MVFFEIYSAVLVTMRTSFVSVLAFAAHALGHGYIYRITADNMV